MADQIATITATAAPPKKRLHEIKEKKAVRYSFDSLLDMVDWLENDWIEDLKETKDGDPRGWHSHEKMKSSFCSSSWKQAVDEALMGHAKKAKGFSELVESISSKLETDIPRLTHAVTGEIIDVGAFLAGEPECFLHRSPRPAPKCIPIYVDMSFVNYIKESLINTRAAAITTLVDKLQLQGFAVDLHLQVKTHLDDMDKPLITDVEVETRPVDVNVLSFLCSSAFFRRFTFAVSEHYCRKNYPSYGGYGKGLGLDRPEEPSFLFVGSYDEDWQSSWWSNEEKAKDHITAMVKAFTEQEEPGPVVG